MSEETRSPEERASDEPAPDAAAVAGPDTGPDAGAVEAPAYYLYGVMRARARRGWRASDRDIQPVRFREIQALVRPASFELPTVDRELLTTHQKMIERVMRRSTVLPAPCGIVFRGRRALLDFLRDQYLVLDEGLAFLDGHWELRLHIMSADAGEADRMLGDEAMHVYTELRRHARAAIPFASEESRLLSAAFLVERAEWIDFVERADTLGDAQPDLAFDITGPWPAYDFVKIVA